MTERPLNNLPNPFDNIAKPEWINPSTGVSPIDKKPINIKQTQMNEAIKLAELRELLDDCGMDNQYLVDTIKEAIENAQFEGAKSGTLLKDYKTIL